MNIDWLVVALLVVAILVSVPGFVALFKLPHAGNRQKTADTFAIMEGTLRRMSERLDTLEQEGERDRHKISELESRVRAWENGVAILTRQIERLNEVPDWKPDDTVMASVPVNLVTLAERIRSLFNNEELNDLAHRIGIEPESIPGQTLPRRANELVEMAQRLGLTGHLIIVCRELRPRAKW